MGSSQGRRDVNSASGYNGVMTIFFHCLTAILLFPATLAAGQKQEAVWSEQEKPIVERMKGLRQMPEMLRADTTRQLAFKIRLLPKSPNKLRLADHLANRATEGDLGHDTLQEVSTTLAAALRDDPPAEEKDGPAEPYVELATLIRYERVVVHLEAPALQAAMAKLEADDKARREANFTLSDLEGKKWTLKELQGKIVVVNFWATWCPPCRSEIPDLQGLYGEFKDKGVVILGISDEEADKVKPFIAEQNVTYPILLDPGRKVNDAFRVQGIPRTFVYNREGKLATQAIDMRTRRQFLTLLRMAGLQ